MGQIEQIESESCRLFWIGQTLRITDCSELELPTIQLAQRQAEAHLRAGNFSQYDGMFLALEQEDMFEGDVTELEQSQCVRVRFRGSHLQAPERMRVCLRTSMRTL